MNRKLWLQTAAMLTLAITGGHQCQVQHGLQTASTLTLAITGVRSKGQSPGLPAVPGGIDRTASPVKSDATEQALVFADALLGGAPRQLTATFEISAGTGVPSASLHYGHDFSLGQALARPAR